MNGISARSSLGLPTVLILTLPTFFGCVSPADTGADDSGGADAPVATFDGQGLSSLRVEGVEFLADGAPAVTRVVTSDRFRDRPAEPLGPHPAPASAGDNREFADADLTPTGRPVFDPKEKRLLLRFGWGRVTVAYRPGADRLDFDVVVHNDSKRVIERVDLRLLTLAVTNAVKVERPSPTVPGRWREISECNLGGPDLRRALHGERQILWLSLQPNRPMRQRLEPGKDGKQLRLTASAGHEKGGAAVYEGVWEWRPIRPGQSDRYALSLRFAPKTTDPFAVAEDVYRAFGKAFPATLDWPDRRPMGALHIGDTRRDGRNPRGWFVLTHDAKFPAATEEGYQEQFRKAMLKNAAKVVRACRRMGVQGVVVWQIGGMQEPGHAYYGEPRILPYVAPEMDAVADDYFRTLREGGLRVGMCLRPVIQMPFDPKVGEHKGELRGVVSWAKMREAALRADWSVQFRGVHWLKSIPEPVRDLYHPDEAWDVVTRLDNKIKYARKRWGATLFYLDTNFLRRPTDRSAEGWAWRRPVIGARLMNEVQRRNPGVLIMAEIPYFEYYAHGAPYVHPPGWGNATGPDVRAAYPEAGGVIAITKAEVILDNLDLYVRAVENGDMLWTKAWYAGDKKVIDAVYGKAAQSAPFQVAVTAQGITLGGERLESPEALRRVLAKRLGDRPPLRERRVFVRHASEVTAGALGAVLDAIAAADGIIAWTQPIGEEERRGP